MNITPRYSVCRPGVPPVEMQSFSDRAAALDFASVQRGLGRPAETWDWAANQVIDEVAA
jgi:hypothetical protein